jgi:hypothetical protein
MIILKDITLNWTHGLMTYWEGMHIRFNIRRCVVYRLNLAIIFTNFIVFMFQTFQKKMGKIYSFWEWTSCQSGSYWSAWQTFALWHAGIEGLREYTIYSQQFSIVLFIVLYSWEDILSVGGYLWVCPNVCPYFFFTLSSFISFQERLTAREAMDHPYFCKFTRIT